MSGILTQPINRNLLADEKVLGKRGAGFSYLFMIRHGKLVLDTNLTEEGVLEEADFYCVTGIVNKSFNLLKNRESRFIFDFGLSLVRVRFPLKWLVEHRIPRLKKLKIRGRGLVFFTFGLIRKGYIRYRVYPAGSMHQKTL